MILRLQDRDSSAGSSLPRGIDFLGNTFFRQGNNALVIIGGTQNHNFTDLQTRSQAERAVVPTHVLGLGNDSLGIVEVIFFELCVPRQLSGDRNGRC